MEAAESHDLLSARCRPRKADDAIPVQGEEKASGPAQTWKAGRRQIFLSLLFVLLEPSVNWIMPTHTEWDHLLYSV